MRRRVPALALAALAACTAPQPCPTPLHECEGQCVDLQSDRRHCGDCGIACAAGQACAAGSCTADPLAPCPQRTGGAFVTLGQCGSAVKVWVQREAFIADAEARLAAPDPSLVPSFALLSRADCDAQWSWHVDALSPSFAAPDPALACTGCPDAIQAQVAAGAAPRTWCPGGATVLAVDRRPRP